MVKFTPEDVTRRAAEADYKKEVASITGASEYAEHARLDMHVVGVMKKIINNQEVLNHALH